MAKFYTEADCGCYADGAMGDLYVNHKTVSLAQNLGYDGKGLPLEQQVEESLDFLNTQCEEGIYFEFYDGNLLLIRRLEEES